jgi:apolipoprotein D and lipocalin family protein
MALAGCSAARAAPVPLAKVDLNQMYGGWYIVATIPNFFERGVVGGYDVFSKGTRDAIKEDFYMRHGGFDAKRRHFVGDIAVLPGTNNADWRVKPVWPLRLPFQVLYVAPDDKFALFGEQNRSLGWIYSRAQTLSDADYAALLGKFKALGYDTAHFRRFVQTPDQVGRPGFWSDGIRPVAASN